MTALLLDIEGTTTSISFVYDVLFPYARATLGAFVEASWATDETQRDVQALLDLHAADADADRDGRLGPASRTPTWISAWLLRLMDGDRKVTPLKSLQGRVWRDGYASGALRGHVYDDVAPMLRARTAAGRPTCIYSSGSVEAQKLLFAHSVAGDLTPHLSGFFDTTTGPKREAASYAAIAAALELPPSRVTFCTDVLEEALAGSAAGMQTRLVVRPGSPVQALHDVAVITSLATMVDA